MEENIGAAFTMINNEVANLPDNDQRWKLIYYKYSKFAIQYPMIAICMAMGHYNEAAVLKFIRKLKACIKDDMKQEEYIELHAHYAKYLYMATHNHYNQQSLNAFMRGAIETLTHLLNEDEREMDGGDSHLDDVKNDIMEEWKSIDPTIYDT